MGIPEQCSNGYYKLYLIRSLKNKNPVTEKLYSIGEQQMSAIDKLAVPLQWQMEKEIKETCVDRTPVDVYYEKVPFSLYDDNGGFIGVSDGKTPVMGIAPMINHGGSVTRTGNGYIYEKKIMEKEEIEARENSLNEEFKVFMNLNLCSGRHCGGKKSWLNQNLAVLKGQLWGVPVQHKKTNPEGGVESLVQHRTFWAVNHNHALHCYSICITGPCKYPVADANGGFDFIDIEWCGSNHTKAVIEA